MDELEAQQVLDAQTRVQAAYSFLQDRLAGRLADWSNWDEAYRFVIDPNQQFIDKNITESALDNIRINVLAFADNRNKMLVGMAVDSTGKTMDFPWAVVNSVMNVDSQSLSKRVSQVVVSEERVYLVQASVVRPSHEPSHPGYGFLLMAEELDARKLEQLEGLTGLKLRLNLDSAKPKRAESNELSLLRKVEALKAWVPLTDHKDQLHAVIQIEIPRTSAAVNMQLDRIRLLLFFIMLPLLITAALGFAYVLISKPLLRLEEQLPVVLDLGSEQLIPVSGNCEIARISQSINEMKIKNQLAEQEKESRG